MSESILRTMSVNFSVKTIKLCDTIKNHRSTVNQLERSATDLQWITPEENIK